jgi:alkylation response protein AidB-like acyl-CoA dehydrogenase
MTLFAFPEVSLPPEGEALRQEVRAFLTSRVTQEHRLAAIGSFGAHDPDFSRTLGAKGWIGLTWPKRYGGGERTQLERLIVNEEMIAAGAPVGAHWGAARQIAPSILRHGTDAQKDYFVPRIAAGDCYFGAGMSEPNSGSDLASIRTFARKVDGGFVVTGSKIWTSDAHHVHYIVLLCRTAERTENRHAGFSQLIVDMTNPQVEVRPIVNMAGEHHFNEVFFNDAFIPDDALLGTLNEGWRQVMSELTFERTGPERFLSSFGLLRQFVDHLGAEPSTQAAQLVGRLVSQLIVLRRMCYSVVGNDGEHAGLRASVVKDMGAVFEQETAELIRTLVDVEPDPGSDDPFAAALARTLLYAPSFSIRGGTREILRGIVAKGLGVR